MARKTEVIDPINLCTHCPHPVIDIGRSMFCPCEDCHYGGLVQGREPKDNHTVAVPSRFSPVAPTPSVPSTDDSSTSDEVWIDPVHRVG